MEWNIDWYYIKSICVYFVYIQNNKKYIIVLLYKNVLSVIHFTNIIKIIKNKIKFDAQVLDVGIRLYPSI